MDSNKIKEQIRERFYKVEGCVQNAAKKAGRRREEITLIAVSKGQPLEKMQALQECLIENKLPVIFGENYVQEFKTKSLRLKPPFSIHLIGPLQSNKAKDAVRLFDVVETMHSLSIAKALDNEAKKLGKTQEVFLQVNISGDDSKSGFEVSQVCKFVKDGIPRFQNLRLKGLMTITKQYERPEGARDDYRKLKILREEVTDLLKSQDIPLEKPLELSMGMSEDFEIAIEEGATYVRIGTALFGARQLNTG